MHKKNRKTNLKIDTHNSIKKDKDFWQGVQSAISKIDGEEFVRSAPAFTFWLFASATVSWFIWRQSISIYESAGFEDASYAALGGLLMVLGFTAIHSLSGSKVALMLCLYACSYEGYLMVSGTVHDDSQLVQQRVETNPELVLLKEQVDKELIDYRRHKKRYQNPESDVFENGWFKKNFLNPALERSQETLKKYVTTKASLIELESSADVTKIKILFRLGLVLLCMACAHRFFRMLRIQIRC